MIKSKRTVSIVVIAITFLAFFYLLLVRAVPSTISPRYGPYVDQQWFIPITNPTAQLVALLNHEVSAGVVPNPSANVPILLAAGFTVFPTLTAGGIIWTAFEGPYEPLGHPGHIGIVNKQGSGPLASDNEWGKLIGRSGWTMAPGEINVWMLGDYLGTLNPLTASSESEWQVLELIVGEGGQLNPYTLAYMPWALTQDPGLVLWTSPEGTPGVHMFFELRQGLKWHDGEPITAADAVFGLDLMRSQQVANYAAVWGPIYDVVQTGTYTWEVYYLAWPTTAARDVADIALMTPKHIWEPFIQPLIDYGAGPMGGDIWINWLNWYYNWRGWMNSLEPDTYNGYDVMELTELIGFGPFIYHYRGWNPGISVNIEANPHYMNLSTGTRWCPADVNKNQFTDGVDIWHVLKRIGEEVWMPRWYEYYGTNPAVQGLAADIVWQAQIIDFADASVFHIHTAHWSGVGDPPSMAWYKEPPA